MTATEAIASSAVTASFSSPRIGRAEVRDLRAACTRPCRSPRRRRPTRGSTPGGSARPFHPTLTVPSEPYKREVGVGRLVDAPREVDGAEHPVRRPEQHARRVLDGAGAATRLPSTAMTSAIGPRKYRTMSTECVPLSMSTPPPRDRRVRVPAPRHVDPRREHVLEQDELAEDPRTDDLTGADHVVDEAELRRHGERDAGPLGGLDHRRTRSRRRSRAASRRGRARRVRSPAARSRGG